MQSEVNFERNRQRQGAKIAGDHALETTRFEGGRARSAWSTLLVTLVAAGPETGHLHPLIGGSNLHGNSVVILFAYNTLSTALRFQLHGYGLVRERCPQTSGRGEAE